MKRFGKSALFKIGFLAQILLLCTVPVHGQNFIETGNFANNCGWDYFSRGGCTSAYFSPSAGTSFIWQSQGTAIGPAYFRLFTDWGGSQQRHEPNTSTLLAFETEHILNSNWGTANANFINIGNIAWNYIFKTPNGDGINNTPQVIIFEVQGNVQTITAVNRTPVAVGTGQVATISATVSGGAVLAAGQGAYLRYTDDGFTTSTVVEMTHSGGGIYTADIPAGVNIAAANVEYYCFTSGDGLSITGPKADWYTLNLNNNGGSNYSYSVAQIWTTDGTGSGYWSDPGSWDPGVIPPVGVDVYIEDNLILDMNAEIGNITIDPGVTFTGDDGNYRALRLQNGGVFTNNGTFQANDGRIEFLGTGSISGTVPFHSVYLNDGVDFGPASTISDTLKVKNGGFVNTNPPAYNMGSVLNYATSSDSLNPYGRYLEWNAPWHVALTDDTWLDWPNGANFTPQTVGGDLHIADGGLLWKDAERELSVDGNVTIGANGTVLMSTMVGGDLFLKEDLTNNGAFYGNNRTVKFNGSAQQRIYGDFTGNHRFHYFDIDNPAGLTPMVNIEIEDTIRFFNGIIFLTNTDLTFTETGTSSTVSAFAPSNSSFISTLGSGEVRKFFAGVDTFLFPVGNTTNLTAYSPATIQFLSGTFASGAYLTCRAIDSLHPLNPATAHYLNRYWEIEERDITDFKYFADLVYIDGDVTGTESLIYSLKSDNGGTTWDFHTLVNTATNQLIYDTLNSFSIFTGGDALTALPVEFSSFTAIREGDQSRLDWHTAFELNSDYFVIERAEPGNNFVPIGSLNAAGISAAGNSYRFYDHSPVRGLNQYRIRQVDQDGSSGLSQIRSVMFEEGQPEIFIPFSRNGNLMVRIQTPEAQAIQLNIYDLSGRLLRMFELDQPEGLKDWNLGRIGLKTGNMILLTAEWPGKFTSRKFILE